MSSDAHCPNCGNTLPAGATGCENCATQSFEAVRTKQDIPAISGYDVLRRIGEGGMGTVYLADELSLGRRVAIKVVSGALASDAQTHARFMREARSLATIEHANVVRIYAFGEVAGLPYLAMEYVDGQTLADRIRRDGKLAVEEAARIMRQILLALDAAWEKGIVHRDIKPSNILLDRRDQVRVADFGLAKAAEYTGDIVVTQSGSVLGTPHYLSPEQAQGHQVDFRSDIYSCGILFYEMLTGERPFEGTTPFAIVAKHLGEPLPPIRSKRSDVPNRVVRLIDAMTQKQPGRRPESYAALIALFDELLGITPSRPIAATATMKSMPLARFVSVRRPLIVAAAIVVGIAIGMLAWNWRHQKSAVRGAPSDSRLAVAIAPFYGPDDDSAKEGRLMAALVERSIREKLGAKNVRMAGIDQTREPLRTHEEARALGEKLGASVVVWGEAYALKKETEIQPYFTFIPRKTASVAKAGEETSGIRQIMAPAQGADASRRLDLAADALANVTQQTSGVVRVESEAPNQIEMRKMSAEGVGEMVSFLAAMHAFYENGDADGALRFLEHAPKSADALRLRGRAFTELAQQADRDFRGAVPEAEVKARDSAAQAFEQSLAVDPNDVQTRADLAETLLLQRRVNDAAVEYERVRASNRPFVTHYAIADGGQLYVREYYRSEHNGTGAMDDTGYMLAVNPRDGVVARRYHIPGLIRSFRPVANGFSIEYSSVQGAADTRVLNFVGGRFDRPLTIGVALLQRMRGMKSGWNLLMNFTRDHSGLIEQQSAHPHFGPDPKPYAGLPKTFPELESTLREAARRDPTQPWHLYGLGQALWAQGRRAEAEKVWADLLTRDFGVIYVEYNFMGKAFERLGQREWADRLEARALRERLRLPQPIQTTTLIERLVNVAIMRLHPEQKKDAERSYTIFRRAREMTGVAEGDHFYAAAWAAHFRRAGDLSRARFESEYGRRAAADPLNFTARHAVSDYALYFFLTASFGFLVTLALLVARAWRGTSLALEPRRAPPASKKWAGSWRAGASAATASAALLTGAGMRSAMVAGGVRNALNVAMPAAFGIAAIALAVVGGARVGRLRQVLERVLLRERRVLVGSFVLFLVASVVVMHRVNEDYAYLTAVPMGIADSLGHPAIVADLEKRLAAQDVPSLRYVTAVANQLGGEFARARQLYGSLPDDARARRAVAALTRGQQVLSFPTQRELIECFTVGAPWLHLETTTVDEMGRPGDLLVVIVYGGAVAGLFFFALCLAVSPAAVRESERAPKGRAVRRLAKIFYVAVPGAFDLSRRAALRGAVMVTLLGFAIFSTVGAVRTAHSLNALESPALFGGGVSLSSAAPLPPDASTFDLVFAPPYAKLFWALAILGVVALLALHAMRIREIVRLFRDEPDATPLLAVTQGV